MKIKKNITRQDIISNMQEVIQDKEKHLLEVAKSDEKVYELPAKSYTFSDVFIMSDGHIAVAITGNSNMITIVRCEIIKNKLCLTDNSTAYSCHTNRSIIDEMMSIYDPDMITFPVFPVWRYNKNTGSTLKLS